MRQRCCLSHLLRVNQKNLSFKPRGTVIYLADNLNEEAKLGWCIDTQGRGFSDKLHSHSCKPGGGDTQFSFDAKSGMIQSVEFEGKCMTLNAPDNAESPFGLLDCVEGDVTQQFNYDKDSMEFRIGIDEDAARLSPLIYEHVNVLGRYSFALTEKIMNGQLRPLNQAPPGEVGHP